MVAVPAFRPSSIMLVPTMACQADCSYCFARLDEGRAQARMSRDVFDAALAFIARVAPDNELQVTFHGGEPLLAGHEFFAYALPQLRKRFGRRVVIGLQSNLWAMTDELAELLARYEVRVGTSVDGPAELCDRQRGEGYYERTAVGRATLQRHGVDAGVICTLGADAADRAAEVFAQSHGPYALHGAVPALGVPPSAECVSPMQLERILLDSYEAYRAQPAHARITSIDALARTVLSGAGIDCTHTVCLGSFAAIGPDGSIYPCQRFCGLEEFCLGNVCDGVGAAEVQASETYRRLASLVDEQDEVCAECTHLSYCHGGCPYNALAAGAKKDPFCPAYAHTFDRIACDAALEMGEVMLGSGAPTPTLAMAGERPHTFELQRKRALVQLALEKGRSGEAFAVEHLRSHHPENDLNKLYLHVTWSCPLRCTHCYAEGGVRKSVELEPEQLVQIVQDACAARFRSVVVTGGEPLAYAGFERLCQQLGELDRTGTRLVLRSSLGFSVTRSLLVRIGALFDGIVVSVDGDRAAHDRRRGVGSYDRVVQNLRTAVELGLAPKLSLAATLSRADARGVPGDAVADLADQLGVSKVRLRPVLPLGRGVGARREEWYPCTDEGSSDAGDVSSLPNLRHSCGLGQNLYVEPDGRAYPCYAWCGPDKLLGNLATERLSDLLARGELYALCSHDVDSNEKCCTCEVRYLCGGMCKAWVSSDGDIDSGAFDCVSRKAHLLAQARRVLLPMRHWADGSCA